MKYISLFSGIGAFEKALDNLNIPYELIGYCEIDKYASKSYAAIHSVPESMNLGDITKIDEKALPTNIDLVTYGFPCQDISLAGKQKGLFNEDGTQTRSGLFFEALRIIEATKPKVAIAENVKNLTSKKFNAQFQIVLESLEQAGYNNYWQVLNAKDFGIPQNRERVFIVSIRKDIDTGCFQFPKGFPLELRLKDMLEDEVDEKYYLKPKDTDVFKMFDLISKDSNGCIQVGNLERPTTHEFSNRVYSPDGIARTLMGSGGNQNDKAGQYLMQVPSIQRVDIPQTVKVRKYTVDCNSLCQCLRNHKAKANISNKDISIALDVPITKVEHWFRQDDCFAIPDPDNWYGLKTLLGIATDEFDESIMTFEEKEGVYEKSERHYHADGIAPTLTSASASNEKVIIQYGIDKSKSNPAVIDVANCITAREDRGISNRAKEGTAIVENVIIGGMQKNQAVKKDGICTCLTSSQQRVVLPEPVCLNSKGGRNGVPGLQPSVQDRVYDSNAISTVVTTGFMPNYTTSDLRIRKLTPKECFRLQGFDDETFHRAEAVNSNTQLYKQAGNSICVPVLEYIFKSLFDSGVFGGEAKQPTFPEGQIEFTDNATFERYIKSYKEG